MKGIVDRLKKNIRISHNNLDKSIQDDVDAALFDMRRVGVSPYLMVNGVPKVEEDGEPALKDELIRKAIEFYIKWQYDYDDKADKWQQAYEKLRDALSLSGEYRDEK